MTLAIFSIEKMRNILCAAKKFVFRFLRVAKTTKVLLVREGGGIREKSLDESFLFFDGASNGQFSF